MLLQTAFLVDGLDLANDFVGDMDVRLQNRNSAERATVISVTSLFICVISQIFSFPFFDEHPIIG